MEDANEQHVRDEDGARAGLSTIAEARRAAVETARRSTWLNVALPLAIGLAFGSTQFHTVLGWVAAAVFFAGFAALGIVEAMKVRRRGRIIDGRAMGWQFLWILGFVILLSLLGSVTLSPPAQQWFALVAGVLVAAYTYGFLRWDEASMAKRLAADDFDPYTLF